MIQALTSLVRFVADANPANIGTQACNLAGAGAIGCGGPGILDANGFVFTAIKTVLLVVGSIAVIMVIVGGLRYVLSGGDSAGIKGAKDTIIYALVGLAISLLSYAIVSFIITKIGT